MSFWTKKREGIFFEFVDWVLYSKDAFNIVQWTAAISNPLIIGLLIYAIYFFYGFNIMVVLFGIILVVNCKKLYNMLRISFTKRSWRVYDMRLLTLRDSLFSKKGDKEK